MKLPISEWRAALRVALQRPASVDASKSKWNALARKNARYYILTNYGEQIDEETFREEGRRDVERYLLQDRTLAARTDRFGEMTVLEIGCGIGRLSEFLAERFGKVICVDISEEMIARAKERLAAKSNVEFFVEDGLGFPQVLPGTVDIVFSFIVFQHMPSKQIVRANLEQAARVMKPNGCAKIQIRGRPVSNDRWYYGASFTRADIETEARRAGLEVFRAEGEGKKYFWIWLRKMAGLCTRDRAAQSLCELGERP